MSSIYHADSGQLIPISSAFRQELQELTSADKQILIQWIQNAAALNVEAATLESEFRALYVERDQALVEGSGPNESLDVARILQEKTSPEFLMLRQSVEAIETRAADVEEAVAFRRKVGSFLEQQREAQPAELRRQVDSYIPVLSQFLG